MYSSLFRMWYFRMILFSCRELSHFQLRKSTFFSSFCSWNLSFRTMFRIYKLIPAKAKGKQKHMCQNYSDEKMSNLKFLTNRTVSHPYDLLTFITYSFATDWWFNFYSGQRFSTLHYFRQQFVGRLFTRAVSVLLSAICFANE